MSEKLTKSEHINSSTKNQDKQTHFGYQTVSENEKTRLVGQVFDSVADQYDLMNDLMSGGVHRYWKKKAITKLNLQTNHKVLDLAGGTGDLSVLIAQKLSNKGQVVLADINFNMVNTGRNQKIDKGHNGNIHYTVVNAEELSFPSNYFDKVTISFGLRNVTNKQQGLDEIYRVLKPKGQLLVVEFSKVKNETLAKAYDWYSFNILPFLGKLIVNDSESYRYLSESIRQHPDQENLANIILKSGFSHCQYDNYLQGVVAMHEAYK